MISRVDRLSEALKQRGYPNTILQTSPKKCAVMFSDRRDLIWTRLPNQRGARKRERWFNRVVIKRANLGQIARDLMFYWDATGRLEYWIRDPGIVGRQEQVVLGQFPDLDAAVKAVQDTLQCLGYTHLLDIYKAPITKPINNDEWMIYQLEKEVERVPVWKWHEHRGASFLAVIAFNVICYYNAETHEVHVDAGTLTNVDCDQIFCKGCDQSVFGGKENPAIDRSVQRFLNAKNSPRIEDHIQSTLSKIGLMHCSQCGATVFEIDTSIYSKFYYTGKNHSIVTDGSTPKLTYIYSIVCNTCNSFNNAPSIPKFVEQVLKDSKES